MQLNIKFQNQTREKKSQPQGILLTEITSHFPPPVMSLYIEAVSKRGECCSLLEQSNTTLSSQPGELKPLQNQNQSMNSAGVKWITRVTIQTLHPWVTVQFH